MSWENDYKREASSFVHIARWTFFRFFWVIIVPIGLLLIILSILFWGIGVGTGVIKQVVNANAIIGNYEWYEQQVKDIKAAEGQIKDAEASVKRFKEDNGSATGWRFDQREEYSRLNSFVTGLRQSRRKLIEDYNARASMITRNLWKHPTLPQHIDEE